MEQPQEQVMVAEEALLVDPKLTEQRQSRRWCFTAYPTEELRSSSDTWTLEVRQWCALVALELTNNPDITFSCFQPELTSVEPKKLHLQGVVYTKKKMTPAGLKKLLKVISLEGRLWKPPHLEMMRGTWEVAVAYCKDPAKRVPEQDSYENGTAPSNTGQGMRNDLIEVHTRIMAGCGEYDLIKEASSFVVWAKYSRAVARAINLKQNDDRRSIGFRLPIIRVVWGPTGSGKSRQAFDEAEEAGASLSLVEPGNGGSSNWYADDVGAAKWLLYDDFYGNIAWHALLRVLGGRATNVQFKGGASLIQPEVVYFTSNQCPRDWYSAEAVPDKAPLFRRIKESGGYVRWLGLNGVSMDGIINDAFELSYPGGVV